MSRIFLQQNLSIRLNYLLEKTKRTPNCNTNQLENRLFIILLSMLSFLLASPVMAQAESNQKIQQSDLPERLIFQQNFNPPGKGQPPKTSGAGSRGGRMCAGDRAPVQPLMPERNFGLSFFERPPVFIRLPKTSAQKVVLTFRDEAGVYTEYAVLPIAQQGDMVSFALPNDKMALTIGKNYQWILALVCGDGQPDDPVFSGWVQRVARPVALEQELSRKTPVQQAQWYAAHGYWYDMLSVLEQERRSHPNDPVLAAIWQDVLKSLQLDAPISNQSSRSATEAKN